METTGCRGQNSFASWSLRLVAALAIGWLAPAPAWGHADDAKRSDAGPIASAAPIEQLNGTVDEIVVDDRIGHTIRMHRELRLDDGSSVALGGPLAATLARGARVEISGRRHGRPLEVGAVRVIAAPVSEAIDPDIEVEGTLSIAHADDFVRGRAEFIYELVEHNGRRELGIATLPPGLRWGMRLAVAGRALPDGSIRPSRITLLAPAPEERVGKLSDVPEKAVHNVLVILANFNNTAVPSYTQAQAQAVMTSSSNSVANFHNEVSYGGQTLNVTVTSWVTMNISRPTSCGASNWQGIGSAAASAAAAANSAWSAVNYGFVVYLFPQVPACGWNGLAYIGSPRRAWINGTNSFVTQVVTHEMGHNWGLLHAGSLDCGSAPIGGGCSVSEYGDPFDTMGNQRAMHFNAQQKRKLNWIASSTVPTHSAGTNIYTLAPIESPGGATYAVRVPTAASNRTYWIEFRQPIGFDAPLSAYPNNGAQIRVASPFETICGDCDDGSNDTQMLDMTPATSTFTDGALLSGQSYSDLTYGVSINVLSASAGALTVQVSTGGSLAPTTTSLTGTPNPSAAGAQVTLSATVTGSAPTGTVGFTSDGSGIAGCAAVALSGSGNARTATCATSALSPGTHIILATYGGDGANAASASNALSQSVAAAQSTTGIASSANPSQQGSIVTFTASVSGNAPTGSVAFTDSGSPIAGCGGAPLGGAGNIRTAACATSSLGAGIHAIVATYSGDGTNAGSASPALQQTVNGAAAVPVNVALAASGAVASASSTYGSAFALSSINDGDRTGANWGNGTGGWADATSNAFPDWVQINFPGARTIDRVVVYTLRDAAGAAIEPADSEGFGLFGIVDFTVSVWNGAGWVAVASVSGNNLVKRTVTFPAVATDRVRVTVSNALFGYSRIVELEAWTPTGGPTNVAALGNGGIASSSSTYSGAFPLISVNDGDRTGATWGNGGGWADATTGAFPDWVQINFSSARTIDRVVLYTLRDSYYGVAVEPSNSEAFGLFGVVDFNVEAWNGSGWFTVASVSGNTQVKRTVAFAAVTTDRIRVNVGHALASYSRIVELEAWTPASGPTNVAAADYGGFAVASSTYSGAFPLAAVNDGDRTGAAWASGGGWADATNNAFPDWVQIDFGAARTIDRVVVYTLRDSYYGTAVEPGDAETFALFGILDFTVQAWNGASWITVGTVSGNNLVKRTIAFGIVTTDRVRVTVTNALFGYSRIVELEAWTP